ncbi:hypothetical protein HID58_089125 [Brassica napus]|uniref:BnaC09g43000D protein n=4 Tax=Brassica TaxID=3705 RepID=A0A078F902_BRANA|nr:hypothetical protein HID58_089125 [Brassica napus]CAF1784530.1 unnamed protein product [Brassica napus]CDY09861.1 BnaC09g43000D [Brassica napus]VDD33781.1 unnamed protein product [Brassica oleracea]
MIDVQAREITEKDLAAALILAHPEAVKYIDPQTRLAAKQKEYKLSMLSEKTLNKVTHLVVQIVHALSTITLVAPGYGQVVFHSRCSFSFSLP